MPLAPGHIVAIAFGTFGLGLIGAAFLGEVFGVTRLLLGLGALVVALIVSGVQLLTGHAAPTRGET